MEIFFNHVLLRMDMQDEIKLAHIVQEKIKNNRPLTDFEKAFRELQREEDREENEEIFRR